MGELHSPISGAMARGASTIAQITRSIEGRQRVRSHIWRRDTSQAYSVGLPQPRGAGLEGCVRGGVAATQRCGEIPDDEKIVRHRQGVREELLRPLHRDCRRSVARFGVER